MSQPTPPPGPPVPGPDGDHGRRSVRIAMISLVVSSVLTVIGFVVTATTSDRGGGGTNGGTTSGSTTTTGGTDGGTSGTDGGSAGGDTEGTDSGGTAGATAGGTDTSGTDSGGTDSGGTDTGAVGGDDSGSGSGGSEGDDGLTTAERDLRDSLNDSQWTRESCVSEIAPGSDAAVTCTVTTESVTMGQVTTKASVAVYPSRSKQQEVYLAYGGTLQEGDCSQMWNVRGSWYESDSGDPTGDMSCYTPNGTQYVIVCTYYDRNAVFQVMGGDPRTLIAWWQGLEPVFVD